MTVEVIMMQGSGGGLVTRFADGFDTQITNGLGDNWAYQGTMYTTTNGAFAHIGPIGVTAGQLDIRANAVNSTMADQLIGFVPIPNYLGIRTRNQFAQIKFINCNSLAGSVREIAAGPSILGRWNVIAGTGFYSQYHLRIDYYPATPAAQIWTLFRVDGGGFNQLAIGGASSVAINDVFRIEGRVNVGSTNVIVQKNGVEIANVNDASANRCTGGNPGMYRSLYVTNAVSPSSQILFDDFLCDAL